MKKKSKYGRNPKLNPKTHCVMVRFDDVEWNRFLTMYEESDRKSTRLNSSHNRESRMPSSA